MASLKLKSVIREDDSYEPTNMEMIDKYIELLTMLKTRYDEVVPSKLPEQDVQKFLYDVGHVFGRYW